MPIRVAIVEDDARVRDALVEMINEAPRLRCVADFPSTEDALKHFPGESTDVALVDINLPGRSGIELVGELKSRWPRLHLVMMTVYEDSEQIFNSLQAGATGYLLKRARPAEIISAIHEVHKGGSPMSPEIARKVVLFFHQRQAAGAAAATEMEALTKRETEILSQLAKGSLYKEIADHMGISLDTVRTHLQHIYNKLQVHSRHEAVMKYLGQQGEN
ncbi:MAG: response regulator transcription factor [Verrucomicrobia bacterium]|jgi:DNA-binding NarL/FixJ family response regulator|nr:response regulator transcription factor [Verrucomicrobiota bacterium]